MDRRGVAVTFFGVAAAGGIAAMIGATVLPTGSPYFDILIIGGLVAVAIGMGGLLWMWLFPARPKRTAARPLIDRSVTSHGQSGGITAQELNVQNDERQTRP